MAVTVRRDSAIAATTPRRSPPARVMSEAAMATSAPVPTATPTSAVASAGASLMPSPTMATTCRRPAGRGPARPSGAAAPRRGTWSIAASAATDRAVAALSPVSIHTSRPSAFSWATAPAESGLTGSATTIRPAASPSTAANIGVWPAAAAGPAAGVSAVTSMPASVRSAALPTRTRRPWTVASMPRPGIAVKRSTAGSARSRSRAAVTIAAPSGCSLPVSAAATIASSAAASQ